MEADFNERAVAGKAARVTDRIVLRKEVTERVETVMDTVRREDVVIETIPAVPASKTGLPKPDFPPPRLRGLLRGLEHILREK